MESCDGPSYAPPFRGGGEVVGESVSTIVVSYPDRELVAKLPKSESGAFGSVSEALSALKSARVTAREISGQLPNVLPESYVVHNSPEGGITASRVQKYVAGVPLRDADTRKLPDDSLDNLLKIFSSNIRLFLSRGSVYDIVGSCSSASGVIQRLGRRIDPLHNSRNVIIDQDGQVQIIDAGILDIKSSAIDRKAAILLEAVGSVFAYISLRRECRIRSLERRNLRIRDALNTE